MGLFFFLAGYYTPSSFDRKGPGRFMTDRLVRIGIPVLIGLFVIVPLQSWMRMDLSPGLQRIGFWNYAVHDFFGIGSKPASWPSGERWPQVNFGHLWFLQHLLVYALLYAVWRLLRGKAAGRSFRPAPPESWMIFAYAVALAAATWAIRIWYPVNRWTAFLGFIQMEPAHLPQYASLFVIGLIACRGEWIETMLTRRGLAWLAVGGGLALLVYIMAAFDMIGGDASVGGSIVALQIRDCVWEAFTCTGLCVGLPVAFRQLRLGANAVWRMLARNVLAIYVFHFPFVLLVQWVLMESGLPKSGGLLLVWPLAAALTVLFTNSVVLRLPGLRRVF
jgi:hypothetical protein